MTYIGYFNKPWDKSEFTAICICPDPFAALFILECYREKSPESMKDSYRLLGDEEVKGLKLIFK